MKSTSRFGSRITRTLQCNLQIEKIVGAIDRDGRLIGWLRHRNETKCATKCTLRRIAEQDEEALHATHFFRLKLCPIKCFFKHPVRPSSRQPSLSSFQIDSFLEEKGEELWPRFIRVSCRQASSPFNESVARRRRHSSAVNEACKT